LSDGCTHLADDTVLTSIFRRQPVS